MRTVIIGHIDMDAFFAAVEERDHPEWTGKPIVVGGDPKGGMGRGVVSTANYAARKYGIFSATPIAKAWKLAEAARLRGEPATIFARGGFGKYSQVSKRVMGILKQTLTQTPSPTILQRSVDEAYFDLGWTGSYEEAEKIARVIKREIFQQEKLTASIGIGPNKLVAKIASDYEKPDGLTVVRPAEVEAWLRPMSVRALPGVGPKMQEKLRRRGIEKISDLHSLSLKELQGWLGRWGESLYNKTRGIGSTNLVDNSVRKSLGEQRTFYEDTLVPSFVLTRIGELCDEVWERFKKTDFNSAKTIVVTVRFADFKTLSRSHTAKEGVVTRDDLYREAVRLVLPFLDKRENPQQKLIRLLGVRLEKLS